MSDRKFEIVGYINCYESECGAYTIPVYKCPNCGSEDVEEIHGYCECHLCEDWGGCQIPRPLIAYRCRKCGKREDV